MLGGAVEPLDFHQKLRTTEDVGLIDACDEMLQRDVAKYSEMVTHWSSEAKHLAGKRRMFFFCIFFRYILYYEYIFGILFGRYEGSLRVPRMVYIYIYMYMKSLSPGMRSQGKTFGQELHKELGFLYRAMRIRSMKPTVKTPEKGQGRGGDMVDGQKSCTTKDDNYSSIYRVLIIPVVQDFFHQQYGWWSCFRLCSDIPPMSVIFRDIFYFVVAHYKTFSGSRNCRVATNQPVLDFCMRAGPLALSQRSGVAVLVLVLVVVSWHRQPCR